LQLLHEQLSLANLFWRKSPMAKSCRLKQSEQKAAVENIRGGFWRKSRVRSLCNT
jgi:hypothetical protein